jgi:hypothetical protein
VLTTLIFGCGTMQQTATPTMRPPQVRPLDTLGHSDPIDRDRLALSRFVGAWDFEGWYDAPGEPRRMAAGIAAGTIENRFFLLLDSARIVVQGERGEVITGAMLLSAEPGIGLMMTAWSEQSPVVHRFRGTVEAEGSRFMFDEVRPLRGNDHLHLVMRFETDDRWIAEFHRISGGSNVIAASYTFTRAM